MCICTLAFVYMTFVCIFCTVCFTCMHVWYLFVCRNLFFRDPFVWFFYIKLWSTAWNSFVSSVAAPDADVAYGPSEYLADLISTMQILSTSLPNLKFHLLIPIAVNNLFAALGNEKYPLKHVVDTTLRKRATRQGVTQRCTKLWWLTRWNSLDLSAGQCGVMKWQMNDQWIPMIGQGFQVRGHLALQPQLIYKHLVGRGTEL